MNIAVIFGGESCEHDISIITGIQLINNIDEYLYNVIPIYIDKNGKWLTGKQLLELDNFKSNLHKLKECAFLPNDELLYVKKGKKLIPYINIDVVIPCLHGMRGEDGTVSAIIEMSKIPYTSSSICSSAVCIDKCIFKDYMRGLKLPIVEGFSITEKDWVVSRDKIIKDILEIGFPIIIKPSRLGSSIGIEICYNINELDNNIKKCIKFDNKLLIEKYIKVNKEINIAMFDNKGSLCVSSTEEPIFNNAILNFEDKYLKSSGGFETIKRKVPADIDEDVSNLIVDIAKKIYISLGLFGVVRFDFLVDDNENVYINEVNTIPGSMANYLFDKKKYPYSILIDKLISSGVHRFKNENGILRSYNSNVLDGGIVGIKK